MRDDRAVPGLMPHVLALDGLRGVAAVWVVLFHLPWPSHFRTAALVQGGYLAVDLFFILSGFVIARAYGARLDSGRAVGLFLWRRCFRIYPLYAVALAVLVLQQALKLGLEAGYPGIGPAAFDGPNSLTALAANVVLAQGWLCFATATWNTPSWSTSVEIAAYGLFAAARWAGLIRSTRTLVLAALLGLSCVAGLALVHGTLDLIGLPGLIRGLAGFATGVLVERLASAGQLPPGLARLQFPVLAAFLLVAMLGGPAVALAPPLCAVLVASLDRDRGPLARVLSGAWAQHLARLSYALYIVHFPVLAVIKAVLKRAEEAGGGLTPWQGDALACGVLVLLWGLSWLACRTIEEPARRWGAAHMPGRRGLAA